MKRTILKLSDFEQQAADILAASYAKRGDGLRMEDIENDEDPPDDAEDEDESDDDEDKDEDKDDKEKDDKKDEKKSDKKKKSDDDESDKVDRSEYDRVKRHRAAADRRNADLTAENTRLTAEVASLKAEGKDGKPDPAATARVTELEGNVTERDGTIQRLRIENAFLTANDFSWHDPQDAMRLADLSDVEIEEDGTVVGLKEALKALARAKPHLIKSTEKADPKGASGSANNGKRKGEGKKVDRATLAKSYPVLRNRV